MAHGLVEELQVRDPDLGGDCLDWQVGVFQQVTCPLDAPPAQVGGGTEAEMLLEDAVLCDGHVKWLRGNQVSSGGSNADDPNNDQAVGGVNKAAETNFANYAVTMSVI